MSQIKYTDAQKKAWKLIGKQGLARHVMLFGGSRSGKTFVLTACVVARAYSYPNSRHAIIREHYNHVKQSIGMDTMPKVLKAFAPHLDYSHNKSDGFFKLCNGSEIWLVGLDNQERVDKILGREFATIYFNECSEINYNSAQTALTRLAQNVEGLQNKAFYDCNPTGKTHWAYKLFVSNIHPISNVAVDSSNYQSMLINPNDNAENLPSGYIEDTLANLSLRQRERFLLGKWQDDLEGALWQQSIIDSYRVREAPPLRRIVVAIDPAVTTSEGSDLTGIVVAGIGLDGEFYVLKDCSLKGTPLEWCRKAVKQYQEYKADRVIGESNNGGDLIEAVLRQVDRNVSYRKVWASKGKITRAEPVTALYEQGRVHHVGLFDELESEMTSYTQDTKESPNRMDALVWAITELCKPTSRAILA